MGECVGLAFPRAAIDEFAVLLTALHRLAAVAVLLPADETGPGFGRLVAEGRVTRIVGPRAWTVSAPVSTVPVLAAEDLVADGELPGHVVRPGDTATVVFTSGTTGEPKAVAVPHGDIMFGMADRLPEFADGPGGRTLLHAFPLSVPVGQWAALAPLLAGLRVVTMARLDPGLFLELVDRHGVTDTAMVPATAAALRDARPRPGTMRRVIVGSARAPMPALRTLRALFPAAELVVDYSSTESGWAGASTVVGDGHRPGLVGAPNAGCAVRITDEHGAPLGPGETGVVELRLPPGIPVRHYPNDPAATAATFRGRWVRMADLGRLDDEGRLHLVARTKDVVSVGGRKVSCPEVEAAFEAHPAIREAAAFPVADPILGEELVIALVADRVVTEPELRAHVVELLAPHKVPARVVIVDDLPRTRSGKVRKSDLPALLAPAAREEGSITGLLTRAVADVLRLDDVGPDRTLADLGASSIQVIRVYRRLSDSLAADFDVTLLFEPVPLATIADRLTDTIQAP